MKVQGPSRQRVADVEGAVHRAGTGLEDSVPASVSGPFYSPQRARLLLVRRLGASVSIATWYRWISCGKVFALRLGYKWLIPHAEVERIVACCRKGESL